MTLDKFFLLHPSACIAVFKQDTFWMAGLMLSNHKGPLLVERGLLPHKAVWGIESALNRRLLDPAWSVDVSSDNDGLTLGKAQGICASHDLEIHDGLSVFEIARMLIEIELEMERKDSIIQELTSRLKSLQALAFQPNS